MVRARTSLACAALVVVCASGCGGGTADSANTKTNSSSSPSLPATTQAPASKTTTAPSTPPSTPPPSSACTPAPSASGPVPDWLPAEFPLPNGTTLVSEQADGTGGHLGVLTAPSASPGPYTQMLTEQLLGAGWTQFAFEEEDAPVNEREASFFKPDRFIVFRINTYTYCRGAAQMTINVR